MNCSGLRGGFPDGPGTREGSAASAGKVRNPALARALPPHRPCPDPLSWEAKSSASGGGGSKCQGHRGRSCWGSGARAQPGPHSSAARGPLHRARHRPTQPWLLNGHMEATRGPTSRPSTEGSVGKMAAAEQGGRHSVNPSLPQAWPSDPAATGPGVDGAGRSPGPSLPSVHTSPRQTPVACSVLFLLLQNAPAVVLRSLALRHRRRPGPHPRALRSPHTRRSLSTTPCAPLPVPSPSPPALGTSQQTESGRFHPLRPAHLTQRDVLKARPCYSASSELTPSHG